MAREAREILGGPAARALWEREEEGTPRELAAAGRWRAAVAAWERLPPADEEERVERAGALAALGRGEAALEALAGLASPAARGLAARCQLELGRLGAARAILKAFEEAPLAPVEVAELAEVAARVYASRGKPGRAGYWIRRALDDTAGFPQAALLARLAAAGAAWDRGDAAALERFLAASEGSLDEADLAWRWHQLRALQAGDAGDLDGAAEAAARAIRAGRRRLTRRQAAGLWNDLGFARARRGDLAGAERAFLHAAHLEAGCDGPRRSTLALYNVAEVRLRQGRTAGVGEIAARSESENRRSGNLRGLAQDAELWARYELALGRPAAALAVCRAALDDLARRQLAWRVPELRLLAARALGWLQRNRRRPPPSWPPCRRRRSASWSPRSARPCARWRAIPRALAARPPALPWPLSGRPLLAGVSASRPRLGGAGGARSLPRRTGDPRSRLSAPRVGAGRVAAAGDRHLPRPRRDTFAERLEAHDCGPWAVVALMLRGFPRAEMPAPEEAQPPSSLAFSRQGRTARSWSARARRCSPRSTASTASLPADCRC